MPRIPRGLVDGFIYHEARKCSLSPFPCFPQKGMSEIVFVDTWGIRALGSLEFGEVERP